jgi:hypothetical protein
MAGRGAVTGAFYHQVKAGNYSYIYEVTDPDELIWYETIVRRATPVFKDFETKEIDENTLKERYPKAEDFGKFGWCYRALKAAEVKFDEIEEKKGADDD